MRVAGEFARRMFPPDLNNGYGGALLPLYAFIPFTGLTLWRSLHHLVSSDGGAQSIATIPLDMFSAEGSAAVIGAFSLWGLSQLIVGLLYVVALVRYRRLLPLLYLLLVAEYFVRYLIGEFKPIPTAGTAPGGVVNLPFTAAAVVLLGLSLRRVNPEWPVWRRTLGF